MNPKTSLLIKPAAAALLLCGMATGFADTVTNVVNSFDSGTAGLTPAASGVWFGTSALAYDPTEDNTGNGGGSLYVQTSFTSGSDHPMADYITVPPYDNLWWNGNGSFTLSQYQSLQFDILWDTNNSTVGIEEFNSGNSWPLSLLPSWDSDPNYLGESGQFQSGLVVGVAGLGTSGGEPVTLGTVQIPYAASNSWQRVTIPINQSLGGIDGAAGIYFQKYVGYGINWAINGTAVSDFWIDNVQFIRNVAPPPPPTASAPVAPVNGLNILANTAGLYDRHEMVLRQTNGLSWVGVATPANPVTYSFTLTGFPQAAGTLNGIAAQIFLCPNPANMDNAPDWNETNNIFITVQQGSGGATMNFAYKVGDPGDNAMYYGNAPYTNAPGSWDGVTPNYYERGALGSLISAGSANGTWSVKFTSNTNITLIAPSGATTNLLIPAYNASQFEETTNPGFYAYIGMQPNNAASLNRAVVYSSFSISGIPSPVSDNFLTDTTLSTNLWTTGPSSGPNAIFVMPSNALWWLQWTTPASGYSLQTASSLTGTWQLQTNDLQIAGTGAIMQLVTTNDIPVGGNQFFRLVNPNP